MVSSVSIEAMFVWRLFADGKLTVEQQSWVIKLLDFVACLTWALRWPIKRTYDASCDTTEQRRILSFLTSTNTSNGLSIPLKPMSYQWYTAADWTMAGRFTMMHNSNVWILALPTWEDSWTAALYNLGSGSWLAWTSGTARTWRKIYWQYGMEKHLTCKRSCQTRQIQLILNLVQLWLSMLSRHEWYSTTFTSVLHLKITTARIPTS